MITILLIVVGYLLIAAFSYIIVVPVIKKYDENFMDDDDSNAIWSFLWFIGAFLLLIRVTFLTCLMCRNKVKLIQDKVYNWLTKSKETPEPIVDEAKSDYRNIVFKN